MCTGPKELRTKSLKQDPDRHASWMSTPIRQHEALQLLELVAPPFERRDPMRAFRRDRSPLRDLSLLRRIPAIW
jgi:hypothetical protein